MDVSPSARPSVPSPAASAASPSHGGNPLVRRVVVGLLLLFHLLLANAATWNKSPTFDETAHIGNGFSFWATGDYRMSPDSILPQRCMTLPLYLAGYQAPKTDNEPWWKADVWTYGRALLYESGNEHWAMLHTARFTNSLWNVGTGLIVYVWAARLFGTAGGFIALLAYLFNPTALAHGSSITTDAAAAFAFTASTAALWTVLHAVTPRTAALSCLAVGCAFVTKFSAVLLVPIGMMIALVRILGRRPLEVRGFGRERQITAGGQQLLVIAGLVAMHVVVAWGIIWTVFGFRYEMMLNAVAGRDVPFHLGTWETTISRAKAPIVPGDPERNLTALSLIEFARDHRLLPEAYLQVFTGSLATTAVRSSFLNGRYGIFGFASFFPYCFLYKTPLAIFALMLAATAAHVTRRILQLRVEGESPWRVLWRGFYASSPWWSLLIVYWFMSITRGINIGIRHILPTFPATFILLGAAGAWLYGLARRWNEAPQNDPDDEERFAALPSGLRSAGRFVASGFIAWLVLESLVAFPNYLAYFNPPSGGYTEGYKHLVDSSLDWGQELPSLKKWLDDNIIRPRNPIPVFVSYMGTSPPSVYGIQGVNWLPCFFQIEALENGRQGAALQYLPGAYCISGTMLQSVYNEQFPGPWRVDYELRYRQLHGLVVEFEKNQKNPQALEALLDQIHTKMPPGSPRPTWQAVINTYQLARFGRFCSFLRHRRPDEIINGAFFIYRLTMIDLQRALNPIDNPPEMYPAPEKPGANVPY